VGPDLVIGLPEHVAARGSDPRRYAFLSCRETGALPSLANHHDRPYPSPGPPPTWEAQRPYRESACLVLENR